MLLFDAHLLVPEMSTIFTLMLVDSACVFRQLCYNSERMHLMGCGQAVRHLVLVQAFGGSNPSIPAKKKRVQLRARFFVT